MFKKNFFKIIFFSILFFVLIFFSFGIYLWQGIFFSKDKGTTKGKIFVVEKGESLFEIADNLEKENLIKNKIFFIFYVFLTGQHKNLKAGKYFLSSAMSIPEISGKIVSGDVAMIKITIPEGFTVKQIEEKLGIKLSEENVEGYLFPDTYYFSVDFTADEVVKIMKDNFDKKIAPYKNEIEKQGKTISEIITMASLIEKEVFNSPDCPDCKNIVSGILWKRLKFGVPLQVDATISYITGKKTTKISIEETKIDHPYNTYKNKGLPPAPICNPGLESILAAIFPKESDFWYYLTTPDGKVIFSKTFEEHVIAKEKYLK